MSVMIQIRNVPDDLHKKLKDRAAEAGMSLSAFMLKESEKVVERSSWAEFQRRLANLRTLALDETPEQTIRAMRDGR